MGFTLKRWATPLLVLMLGMATALIWLACTLQGAMLDKAEAQATTSFTPVEGAPLGWGVRCEPPHTEGAFDPIVSWGVSAPVGHLHTFFGGFPIDENTTNEILRSGSGTSCHLSADRAAYWFPSEDGGLSSVRHITAYYRPTPRSDNGDYHPYSDDLKIVAGSVPMDRSNRPSEKVDWGCQGEPATWPRPIDCGTKRVKVEVLFPDCQAVDDSGVPIDDSDNHRDHMAYSSTGTCPLTHPYKVAQLHLQIIFNATNSKKLGFSVPTYDFHADFMNGWDQGVYDQLLRECIEGQQYGCQIVSSAA